MKRLTFISAFMLAFSSLCFGQAFYTRTTLQATGYVTDVNASVSGGVLYINDGSEPPPQGKIGYVSHTQDFDNYYSIFLFNLSGIPSNAKIVGATLNSWVTSYDQSESSDSVNLNYASPSYRYTCSDTNSSEIAQARLNSPDGFITYQAYADTLHESVVDSVQANLASGYILLFAWNDQGTEIGNTLAQVNLTLDLTYYIPQAFSVTFQNNFTGGVMGIVGPGVSNSSQSVPYTDANTELGSSYTLTAVAQQDNSGINRVWNNYAPNDISSWQKQPSSGQQFDVSSAQTYSFNADTSDVNATYTANLRQNFEISRNDETEFDGTILRNNVTQILEQNSGAVPAPATQTINGHSYNFAGWENGGNGDISNPTSNMTYPDAAIYKTIHYSNDPLAFSNNGQRRLIETSSGGEAWLTQVYASMGHVWIEHSSDGGNTWAIGNNGKPLDTGGGKDPSIAFTSNSQYNYIGVVWEQPSGSTYAIMGKIFNQYMGSPDIPHPVLPVTTLFTEPSGGDGYSVNADPNLTLAGGQAGTYLLTFEQKSASVGYQPGVNWSLGNIQDGLTGWDGPFEIPPSNGITSGIVSGTDANSTDFQMSPFSGYNGSTDISVNYIYREGSPAGTIYSGYLVFYTEQGNWYNTGSSYGMVSYNADINLSPSIVSLANGDFDAACWLEYNTLVFWNQAQSVRYYYGTNDAQSCSINIGGTDTSSSGFVAWSTDVNGGWANNSMRFVDGSPNSSTMQTLNTAGEYVEVGNGANASSDLSDMYVSSFYPFTSPYTFETSGTLAPLSKASPQLVKGPTFTTASGGGSAQLAEGRGFMIKKGNVSFTYRFGDLNVGGQNIGFVAAPDTANYGNLNTLNSALETQPFQVNTGSQVVFTERSGFADSTAAVNALGKHDYIGYRVEVVDNTTGDVLGMIAKNSITSSSVHPFKTSSYQLNTAGLTGKTLRVKIVVSTNLPASSVATSLNASDSLPAPIAAEIARSNVPHSNIFLVKSFARHNQALAAVASNDLSMLNLQVPTTYSLSQNYPNPFNPTTVIDYAIPKDSHVTLRIYDVLGQEVETLVNEEQNVGRYQVQFNGSRLASGVYFYRLVAGNHIITKKMLMLK